MTPEEKAKASLAAKRKARADAEAALAAKIDQDRRDVPPGIEAEITETLREQMNVAQKLLWVQTRMRVAKNRGKGHTPNAKVTYEYRNAEDILEAAKPLCDEIGAVLTVSVRPEMIGANVPLDVREVKPAGKDDNNNPTSPTYARAFGPRFVAVAMAQFRNCYGAAGIIECSAFAEIDFWRKGQTEPEKLCGSADSYASKYALAHLFALDNNRDADMESDLGAKQSAPKPDPF